MIKQLNLFENQISDREAFWFSHPFKNSEKLTCNEYEDDPKGNKYVFNTCFGCKNHNKCIDEFVLRNKN